MSSWADVTDWPPLTSLASQGFNILGVSLQKAVEPGDKETRAAFDWFRNQLVQQNCHRDVEIRTWDTWDIPDMGPDQTIFVSTRPTSQVVMLVMQWCNGLNLQTPAFLTIGCFLGLGVACLACPLRTYLRSRTKLFQARARGLRTIQSVIS